MSAAIPTAVVPARSNSRSASASSASSLGDDTMQRLAPSLASRLAVASPMPLEPPVMSTTVPSNRPSSGIVTPPPLQGLDGLGAHHAQYPRWLVRALRD